jgi:hypothetical protein
VLQELPHANDLCFDLLQARNCQSVALPLPLVIQPPPQRNGYERNHGEQVANRKLKH